MKAKSWLVLAAAALMTAGMSSVASAESIVYSTSGAFTANTSGGIVTTSPAAIEFGSGANTVTLTFTGDTESLDSPVTGDLGIFAITSTGSGATAGDGTANFELTISQTVPGSGSGSSGGVIKDKFSGNVTATTHGFLIKLDPTSLNITGVTYQLDNLGGTGNDILSVGGASTTVNADITAVPLPASAWGGMGLLGAMGLARVRRQARA